MAGARKGKGEGKIGRAREGREGGGLGRAGRAWAGDLIAAMYLPLQNGKDFNF